MGVHWEDAFFAKFADPGPNAVRPVPFLQTPEDGAPRLLHVRPMAPESTVETAPHTASQAHD